MSELPSITVTKKPVTPQYPASIHSENTAGSFVSVTSGSRMSRRDRYIHDQMATAAQPTHAITRVEVSVSPYPQQGFNRLVISPTVSIVSASAEDMATLAVHGEKLTPQHSPRGSPLHSPTRYAPHSQYVMAAGHHVSPGRASNFNPYTQSVVSAANSPYTSPHHSPANSIYNGSPSHSPSRFFTSDSRRISDLSNYSGDDVSLHKYITQPVVAGVVYASQQSPYNQPSYTPVSIAMPLHSRTNILNKGGVNSRDASPNSVVYVEAQPSLSPNNRITKVKDMSTQTFQTQETKLKHSRDKHKHKSSKRAQKQNKKVTQFNNNSSMLQDLSNTFQRDKSFVQMKTNDNTISKSEEPKRSKAVLVMRTVTTVTPTSEADQDTMKEPTSYSRESTIHIDIDYDSNTSAEDILKTAMISSLPNAQISTVFKPGPSEKLPPPTSPSHDRRSSVSGPIPEISLMCATPDDLTPSSPGIPKIDGENYSVSVLD